MRSFILSIFLIYIIPATVAACYDASSMYPLPNLSHNTPKLQDVFDSIGASLEQIVSDEAFNTSSFSVEVTSSQETLWSSHHTASKRDNLRTGAGTIDGRSVYCIASVTKVFTVLGILQQHAAGNLTLDDAITTYIEELSKPQEGSIPWKDITLRSLASQLSGIPRECKLDFCRSYRVQS